VVVTRIDKPLELELKAVVHLDRDPDEVFGELHDPETLLSCVPGARLTTLYSRRKFRAQIVFGVGPFKLPYTATGTIVGSNPRSRTASIRVDGQHDAIMPEVRVRMAMAIEDDAPGCAIDMTFHVAVASRTRHVTHALVDPIACELMERTVHRLRQRLEQSQLAPMPPAA
jgi:carbon monoxide dehydrogenase subunit G